MILKKLLPLFAVFGLAILIGANQYGSGYAYAPIGPSGPVGPSGPMGASGPMPAGVSVALTAPYEMAIGLSAGNLAAPPTGSDNYFIGRGSGVGASGAAAYNVGLGYGTIGGAAYSGTLATAVGSFACGGLTGANGQDTCIGYGAGATITSGFSNLCLGFDGLASAGSCHGITTGIYNIDLNVGPGSNESYTTRIGNSQTTAAYIAGIYGATVTGTAVLASSSGQLGTVASSRDFKKDIKDMQDVSSEIMALRPVAFKYKEGPGDQRYGLIAEEVALVDKDLVLYNNNPKSPRFGKADTVKYELVNAMYLAMIQQQQKTIATQNKRLEVLERLFDRKKASSQPASRASH